MVSAAAQQLWQLWQEHDPGNPTPATLAFRTAMEHLLATQTLDDTVESVYSLVTTPEELDSYGELRRTALAHACMLILSSKNDPAARYTAFGMAFTLVGADDQLAFEATFESDLRAYLNERVPVAANGQPKWADFHLVPRLLHLETCGQLKMDTWRDLLMEQVTQHPGEAWRRAETVERQVEEQIHPIASSLVQEMGERVAVMLVVVRDDDWTFQDVDQWMGTLCRDEAWKARFTTPNRAVLPLTTLRDALALGVGHRLTTALSISLHDRELTFDTDNDLDFHLNQDPDNRETIVWSATLNGTELDPVPFTHHLMNMVGHAGMQEIYQVVVQELGQQAQRTRAAVEAENDGLPLVRPPPPRRRLN